MQHYVVQVWKSVRIADRQQAGAEDYEEPTEAYTPAEAAKNILAAKHVSGTFYVEVRLKDDKQQCWGYDDTNSEIQTEQ